MAHFPLSIFFVVDAFDDKGKLRRMLPKVPRTIDLGKFTQDPLKPLPVICAGFISLDPFNHDYKCYLRNKKRDEEGKICWTEFDRKGNNITICDKTLFGAKNMQHNAQIMLFKKQVFTNA